MKELTKMLKGKTGALAIGVSVGSMVARFVDDVASAGEIISIGIVTFAITIVIGGIIYKGE